jgi:hypothetical protein
MSACVVSDFNQVFEVDTPNLAFTLRQPGEYRIEVDPDGNATTIVMRKGQGEVYGEDASYVIDSRQPYRFMGTGLRASTSMSMRRVSTNLIAGRAIAIAATIHRSPLAMRSPDVIGYQTSMRTAPGASTRATATSGSNRVAIGWAPYRDGHWAWIDPRVGLGWMTRPGVSPCPITAAGRISAERGVGYPVPYALAPTMPRHWSCSSAAATSSFRSPVASSVESGGSRLGCARSINRPIRSRRYFENVNHSNTVINNTVINNTYNNINVTQCWCMRTSESREP